MRSIRLIIAYDGTAFHGFQRQRAEHGPTIQQSLETVWKCLFEENVHFVPAGRTDAGVHARAQVVSFQTAARIPLAKIPKAMNSLLEPDIRILQAEAAEADFNARYSAYWKRYDYWVDNNPIADVFTRRFAYHVPVSLDQTLMARAAAHLEGRHDFRAFAAAGGASKTFIRTLSHCQVAEANGLIRITCVGDGFLYNMVRILAGTLINLGAWKTQNASQDTVRAEEKIEEILASRDRTRAGKTVPARGLALTHVEYDRRKPSLVYPDLKPSIWEESLVRHTALERYRLRAHREDQIENY